MVFICKISILAVSCYSLGLSTTYPEVTIEMLYLTLFFVKIKYKYAVPPIFHKGAGYKTSEWQQAYAHFYFFSLDFY